MFKHMLLGLGAASLLVVVTAMPVQAAHINLPQPVESDIVSVLGTDGISYRWVWASACPGFQLNCDSDGDLIGDNEDGIPESIGIPDAGDGSIHGFTYASADQWIASFPTLADLDKAFVMRNSVGDPISTICAAASFAHSVESRTCNPNEILLAGNTPVGNIWYSPLGIPSDLPSTPDTFLVCVNCSGPDPNNYVPEPSSLLLLGAGLLGLAAWRWKHAA